MRDEFRDFLSQETRHDIIQVILGHPEHLVSVTELDHYLPKSRSTIRYHLKKLRDHHLVQAYHCSSSAYGRDEPATFWGFTEPAVDVLAEFNYLEGLPILRAVHDATRKTGTVQRHEKAARPALPDPVSDGLDFCGSLPEDDCDRLSTHFDRSGQSLFADAAPDDSQVLNDSDGGDRTIEELFD